MKNENTAKDFDGRSVYERTTAVFFDSNPVEDLNDTVHHKFMGYGTAAHEFFNEKKVLIEMARTQSDQIRNSNIEVNRKIIFERALADSTSYLIVEEFDFHDVDNGHHYSMRLSTILEKTDGRWLVSHMHGSTPDSNIAEEEALPMEGLRRKNRELEKKIKEGIREAELEAALERIRSSSLAMQKPDDLRDVVTVLFEQMQELSVDMGFASVSIFIFEEGTRDFTQWLPLPDGVTSLHIPYIDHPITSDLFDARESGTDYFEKVYSVEEKNSWVKKGFEATDYKKLPEEFKTFLLEAPGYAMSISLAKHSGICIPSFDGKLPSPENVAILKRVGKVFEQAYTRFLDLQKAEAQAREAQIEASLEKVRAQTMGMQSSDDLSKVASVMFEQMKSLGGELFAFGIVLCDKDKDTVEQWHNLGNEGMISPFTVPVDLDYIHRYRYEQWKAGEELFSIEIPEDYIARHFELMFELPSVKAAMDEVAAQGIDVEIPDWEIDYGASFKHGYLLVSSRKPFKEDHIFPRFANVFEQAYTRFLDLQKAEAQAREAQIEAALEKVRSRSLAMHKSDELKEVVSVLFEKLKDLQIPFTAIGIATNIEGSKDLNAFVCVQNEAGLVITNYRLPYFDNPIPKDLYNALEKQLDFYVGHYSKEEKDAFYNYVIEHTAEFRHLPEDIKRMIFGSPTYTISMVAVKNAVFNVNDFEGKVLAEDEVDIIKRFVRVFDQAYTRFLDLQKSEAQAREAQIELSLERIRSQVTAMQESSDLLDIVVTMRSEFVKLGHEAHYFWHMRWLPERYDKAMTSGDGTKIGMVMTLPRHIHGDIPLVADWEKTKEPTVVLAMEVDTAVDYVHKMITLGDFEQVDPQAPTLDDIRHIGGLTFVMARTTHGEIGYSLPGEVPHPPQEALDTLVRFAGVFDLAYQRFEDLQESERQARLILEERDRLEIALKELHATQDQLVQQEKLASLGQLTAGIAHEIKNPLNFVNNFSEVSIEMVEEAREEARQLTEDGGRKNSPLEGSGKAERSRGVSDEAKNETPALLLEILDDIEANLRKIHEHGSRADGIVKSMLQHSRGGDGKMEPTPLIPIIKEYVNLAFHGMRAGKEPIDVGIDLQLDENVGEVPLIAEDFSRVILNLCNNGFDAMRDKLTGDGGPETGYVPKLTVRTKSDNGKVTIEIEDNGPGIHEEIKDKILQPFFTTKKGTQGTGLGLSITNDIVKAHGGELSVNSTSGSGSTFIITLKL